jgi:hypothetical protein
MDANEQKIQSTISGCTAATATASRRHRLSQQMLRALSRMQQNIRQMRSLTDQYERAVQERDARHARVLNNGRSTRTTAKLEES